MIKTTFLLPIKQGDLLEALQAMILRVKLSLDHHSILYNSNKTLDPLILVSSEFVKHNQFLAPFQWPALQQSNTQLITPFLKKGLQQEVDAYIQEIQTKNLTNEAITVWKLPQLIALYQQCQFLYAADYQQFTTQTLKQVSVFYEYTVYKAFNEFIQQGQPYDAKRLQQYLLLFNSNSKTQGLAFWEAKPQLDYIDQVLNVETVGSFEDTEAKKQSFMLLDYPYFIDYTAYRLFIKYPNFKNLVLYNVGNKNITFHVRSLTKQAPAIAHYLSSALAIKTDSVILPNKAYIKTSNYKVYNAIRDSILEVLHCTPLQK